MHPKESVMLWPWEISEPVKGPAVMVDVLAASYNIIHLSQKARRLFTVTNDTVLMALGMYPDAALIGETDNPRLQGRLKDRFISSNSPSSVVRTDVVGRDVILITNNGTHALARLIACGADPVMVGHWINIASLADYLRTHHSHFMYLVPSGGRETVFAGSRGKLMEDWYCAQALQDLLSGKPHDVSDDFRRSRNAIALQYPVSQKEDDLTLIFQANTTRGIPFCYPVALGIIEVKRETV